MKEKIKGLIPYIIIIIVVIIIRSFVITPVRVNGPSMEDTLYDGDILLLVRLDKSYKRNDIVVVDNDLTGEPIIKRIIGMPGEKIEIKNGVVYIDSSKIDDIVEDIDETDMTPITLGDDEYFVLGDNRNNSSDSRDIGKINKSDIDGTVHLRLFPFNKIGSVN